MIPMLAEPTHIDYLVGDEALLSRIAEVPARRPFSAEALAFIDTFSQHLLRLPDVKAWSDVVTLAFWCRSAALRLLQNGYSDLAGRQGRGAAFHIAPSNVAVNFAYSLLAGLLAGNANILRVPGRDFTQVRLICAALNSALQAHPQMAPYLILVRYDKSKTLNDRFSALCQTRIVWGGDNTIAALRQSPLPPRALDIAFANRYSFALVDAQGYLDHPDKVRIAHDFYNDTLQSDQNACSSPGLVVWLTASQQICEQAQRQFWQLFNQVAAERYALQPVSAVEKLTLFCQLSAATPGVKRQPVTHNRLVRVTLPRLDAESMNYAGRCGYFLEYQAGNIDEIFPICGSACQTIAYCGMDSEPLEAFLTRRCPAGVDRIVPFGQALNFTLKWDGYDLIYMLTKVRATHRNNRIKR